MSACLDYVWACRGHWKTKVPWDTGGRDLDHRDGVENRFISAGLVTIVLDCNSKWSQETGSRLNLGFYGITNVKSEHVKMPNLFFDICDSINRLGSSAVLLRRWLISGPVTPTDRITWLRLCCPSQPRVSLTWNKNQKQSYLIGCAALTLWLHQRNHVRHLEHARPRLASCSAESAGRAHRLNWLLCPLVWTRVVKEHPQRIKLLIWSP